MSDELKIPVYDGKVPSMGGIVMKVPFGESPVSGDVYEPVQELPADPEENIIYYKLSSNTGTYESVDRPTGGTELFYKIVPFMGFPVTFNYDASKVCYNVTIDIPGSSFSFQLPLAFCDRDVVLNDDNISPCFQQVFTREEADLHVYYDSDRSVGHNLMIPINMEPADLPEESYVKLIDEEKQDFSVNILENTFYNDRRKYSLNWDEGLLAAFFVTKVDDGKFICPTDKSDADFVFSYKKLIKDGGHVFPAGIAVHGPAQYMYTAYYRDDQWHYIDYAPIESLDVDKMVGVPVAADLFKEEIDNTRLNSYPRICTPDHTSEFYGFNVPALSGEDIKFIAEQLYVPVIIKYFNTPSLFSTNVVGRLYYDGAETYYEAIVRYDTFTAKYTTQQSDLEAINIEIVDPYIIYIGGETYTVDLDTDPVPAFPKSETSKLKESYEAGCHPVLYWDPVGITGGEPARLQVLGLEIFGAGLKFSIMVHGKVMCYYEFDGSEPESYIYPTVI